MGPARSGRTIRALLEQRVADGLADDLGDEWSLFGLEDLAELFDAPSR